MSGNKLKETFASKVLIKRWMKGRLQRMNEEQEVKKWGQWSNRGKQMGEEARRKVKTKPTRMKQWYFEN